jgi:hypothetical protein
MKERDLQILEMILLIMAGVGEVVVDLVVVVQNLINSDRPVSYSGDFLLVLVFDFFVFLYI